MSRSMLYHNSRLRTQTRRDPPKELWWPFMNCYYEYLECCPLPRTRSPKSFSFFSQSFLLGADGGPDQLRCMIYAIGFVINWSEQRTRGACISFRLLPRHSGTLVFSVNVGLSLSPITQKTWTKGSKKQMQGTWGRRYSAYKAARLKTKRRKTGRG